MQNMTAHITQTINPKILINFATLFLSAELKNFSPIFLASYIAVTQIAITINKNIFILTSLSNLNFVSFAK